MAGHTVTPALSPGLDRSGSFCLHAVRLLGRRMRGRVGCFPWLRVCHFPSDMLSSTCPGLLSVFLQWLSSLCLLEGLAPRTGFLSYYISHVCNKVTLQPLLLGTPSSNTCLPVCMVFMVSLRGGGPRQLRSVGGWFASTNKQKKHFRLATLSVRGGRAAGNVYEHRQRHKVVQNVLAMADAVTRTSGLTPARRRAE